MTAVQQDEPLPTFFVRALFDFTGTDTNSLSFRRGDIIEVLSRLDSGWWDGLLDDERGWFPSNYVVRISDGDAEEEISARHPAAHPAHVQQDIARGQNEWMHEEMSGGGGMDALADATMAQSGQSSDFWVPQVTPDGQIYYVNTVTGEQSRDLPSDADDSDAPSVPYTQTPMRSRSGTQTTNNTVTTTTTTDSSRLGSSRQGTTSSVGSSTTAGFGFFKRTSTPEPWVKRLADDGMSYYYLNTVDGQVRWTVPSPDEEPLAPSFGYTKGDNRSRSGSTASASGQNSRSASSDGLSRATDGYNLHLQRLSVYSDDSEIHPLAGSDPDLGNPETAQHRPESPTSRRTGSTVNGAILSQTPSDILSRQLQDRLAPAASPSLASFSDAARDAIAKVVESFSDSVPGRPGGSDQGDHASRTSSAMAERVALVVVAVRNLLYVSGTLAGPIPGGFTASMIPDETSRQELKPYQRKVTATLSKLVLSARAAGSGPDWNQPNATTSTGLSRSRVEAEAAELDRALVTFVLELQRTASRRHSRMSVVLAAGETAKRLKGVLVSGDGAAGVGLCLVGAGAAGNWRGAGYVPLDGMDITQPRRRISAETVDELAASKSRVEERLNALGEVVEAFKKDGNVNSVKQACPADQLVYTGRLSVAYLSTLIAIIEDINLSAQVAVDASALGRSELVHGSNLDQASLAAISQHTGLDAQVVNTYMTSLRHGAALLRLFELSKQAVYDDGIILFMAVQSAVMTADIQFATRTVGQPSNLSQPSRLISAPSLEMVGSAVYAIRLHMAQLLHSLADLVSVAQIQDNIQLQVNQRRPLSELAPLQELIIPINQYEQQAAFDHEEATRQALEEDEEYIDFEQAFNRKAAPPVQPTAGSRALNPGASSPYYRQDLGYNSDSQGEGSNVYGERGPAKAFNANHFSQEVARSRSGSQSGSAPVNAAYEASPTSTYIGSAFQTPVSTESIGNGAFAPQKNGVNGDSTLYDEEEEVDDDGLSILEDETVAKSKFKGSKLKKVLGEVPDHYLQSVNQDSIPFYLRPIHGPKEILISPDGSVRGGTLSALVERLTMHDNRDAKFNDTFLMTFKSFATPDELFEQLVHRFHLPVPDGLTPEQLKEWTDSKQAPIRIRVINIFKSMIIDDDVLDNKEDAHILMRIKDFATEVMGVVPAAKQLLGLVERAQRAPDNMRTLTLSTPAFPPPSILPKTSRRLKLLDIDPLELARQLTLLESDLFFKIRQGEALARAKDSTPNDADNIKSVITTSNKVADWVADSILSKDDSRKRAAVIRMFISVADKCRALNNFSTMAALIAGLNCPPIRRLKRTWEQVNARMIGQLDDLEKTLDSGRNFTNYKALLSKIDPPCVPFLGVYLTLLTFIQDGNKDILVKEGNLINFGKRQRTAEVIREIKAYQSKPFNLARIPPIRAFIDESLASLEPTRDFWELSLEREPREREDEKMARLLQESGFL